MQIENPETLVIYSDRNLVAAAKPAGWETFVQGGGKNCFSSLLRRALNLPRLAPAHRLDRDTTGVQLFGTDDASLKKLEDIFRQRQTIKLYLALCLGVPRNPSGTIRRNLTEWQGGHMPVRVVKGRGGLEAETDYKLLISGEGSASLVLFRPRQGRTHQIRVHAQALGYPVAGDDQYGHRPENAALKKSCGLARQALHAWRIALPHPENGEILKLEAPLPEDLRRACDSLFPDWETSLSKCEQ
jgi:RluA family pseudouridine synthase